MWPRTQAPGWPTNWDDPRRRSGSSLTRRNFGTRGVDPGGHRHFHATRERLRPRLAFARTDRNRLAAAIREALWNRLSAFLMSGHRGYVIVVFVTDVVLVGLRPYLTDLPAGRFAWKARNRW